MSVRETERLWVKLKNTSVRVAAKCRKTSNKPVTARLRIKDPKTIFENPIIKTDFVSIKHDLKQYACRYLYKNRVVSCLSITFSSLVESSGVCAKIQI